MRSVRRRSWVIAVTLSFALLAACRTSSSTTNPPGGGGNETTTTESSAPAVEPTVAQEPTSPVTISFAAPGYIVNSPNIKKFAKEFEKQHPNITIEFQSVPFEQEHDKLLTQFAAGTAPDTAFIDASASTDFGQRGALVPLDGYIAGSKVIDPDQYVPAFLQMNQVGGQTFGLPFDGESTALFYRTDLFEKAGIDHPPATWEEFEADARKLTDPSKKQYGFIEFAPEVEYYWLPFLYSAGGELADEDGTPLWTSPEAKRAAEFFLEIGKCCSPPDAYNSNSYDGRVYFANGKVAMYEAGAWFAGTTQGEFPDIKGKWAVAPLPQDKECATTIAGDSLILFNSSKNQDAAFLWLEFLSQPENIIQWTTSEGQSLLPPLTDALENPGDTFKNFPELQGFVDQMKCGITLNIDNASFPEAEQKLKDRMGEALFGKLTPTEALETAKQQADEVLAQG